MIGHILCWIGWHRWRYVMAMAGARVGSRAEARDLDKIGYIILCDRCGIRP